MKKVTLGNTGIEVSIVGFGVLPIGPSQLALPTEKGAEIIKYAFRNGINFIDTAQYYRAYPYISEALKDGEFGNIVICSKSLSADYDGMMEAILEARKELNRDVIDIFLMH
ncbi:MAG: aldo/keto reductase, partial [Anaerotignum sp.]|nr:aldo/keto reductase [Anaerotignum sp.]